MHRLLLLLALGSLLLLLPSHAQQEQQQVNHDGSTTSSQQQIAELQSLAQSLSPSDPAFSAVWHQLLQLQPTDWKTVLQVGLIEISKNPEKAINLLQRLFHGPSMNGNTIPMPTAQGYSVAMLIGRYCWEERRYEEAKVFLDMGIRAAEAIPDLDPTCGRLSVATILHPFPVSVEHADAMWEDYRERATNFHKASFSKRIDENQISEMVIGASIDPFVHCTLTIFHLSFYYRADIALSASLWTKNVLQVWPELGYVSPKFPELETAPHLNQDKPCITRKLRLGIASGLLSHQSPVSSDFMGVLQRLNRNHFDITYMYFIERGGGSKANEQPDAFVFTHRDRDRYLPFQRQDREERNSTWVMRQYEDVEALDLDILLYLDLTMSLLTTRMSMARLARVQATSHGHPVTSGVPAVQYYISWGAAELEYEQSKEHYSETLLLLNETIPHQYYEYRFDPVTGTSRMDGKSYKNIISRNTFANHVPNTVINSASHWYTCMQKPHKFMPEFDEMLCGVLKQDPKGRLLLHTPDTSQALDTIKDRLNKEGCDMDRVFFLPSQPHHKLLALYNVSTVILDSYPAGGCTTTRESLEIGTVVVTRPGRLLGGRWTYAYYNILNDQVVKDHVIAESAEEYVEKAVALGTNETLRLEVQERIRLSMPNLYGQMSAVHSWEEMLWKIAPFQRKETCGSNES